MEQWYEGAVYNRRFTFRYGDCDDKSRGSLFSVMKLLSEIAGEGYGGLGKEYAELWRTGQAFLLSRMSLRFHRTPVYTESVIASTWAREARGPLFYRDFEIRSEEGAVLVSASSAWLLVDIGSREILRPEALTLPPKTESRVADCPESKKIRADKKLVPIGERPVYHSDLDGNGHMNNAVYGRIATDFLPEIYREKALRDVFVDFHLETKLGQALEIYGGGVKNGYKLQGRIGDELHFGTEFIYED